MRFGVMMTQGPGGHPSWKHAEITADKLVVDPLPTASDYAAKYEAAAQLRRKLRDELIKHHDDVQADTGPVDQRIGETVGTVQALTKGTILEAHYQDPEVIRAMQDVLLCEFNTQLYIKRQWAKGA